MAKFLALCPLGLHSVLEQELRELGFSGLDRKEAGVIFETDWAGCYKANLELRSATRVLYPILWFRTNNPEGLYDNIRKHDFTKYIDAKGTMAVDAMVKESPFTDQRFVAMKVKDAIADQFTEKFDERPDVDKKDPELFVWVRIKGDSVNVYIDTSGESLFKRGYRRESVPAPVKENVAGGLLKMTGWDGSVPLLDPMCGSGTFLIEAALLGLGVAPGSLRKRFGFQRLSNYDRGLWEQIVDESASKEKETLAVPLFGFDIDRDAVKAAQINARSAGVADLMEIKRASITQLEPPAETGMIIVNPPYGERLQRDQPIMEDTYKDLGFILRTRFKGWTAWVLTNQQTCSAMLQLKASKRIMLNNGSIPCEFFKYEIKK